MSDEDIKFLKKTQGAFRETGFLTLADIHARVADANGSTKRRDTLSALDTAAKAFEISLAQVTASLRVAQTLFGTKSAAELSLSEKRYANVRSAVLQAIRNHGRDPGAVRARPIFNDEWRALLKKLDGRLPPYSLHRLAYFCSIAGIAPDQITPEVLKAFWEAIKAEGKVKNPRRALLQAITHWNLCAKTIADWPAPSRLSMPTQRIYFMLPWSAFPSDLLEDYQKLVFRLVKPDIFSEDAPRRPFRPASIRNWEVMIGRYASALVQSGNRTDDFHALANLVPDFETYERGLRVLHERSGKTDPTEYLGKHARTIMNMAEHHCEVNEVTLKRMNALCKRLERPKDNQLAISNREKLRPFDERKNVDALLEFPQQEYARAKRQTSPARAAKYVERALAVSILINFCLRLYNLRTLRLDDFRWQKSGCYLTITADRVKNRQRLEFQLPDELAQLLREFIDVHRNLIAEAGNQYLFAGRAGKPRHQNSLREQIENALLKRSGLRVTPHLFRHIIAKIVIEASPGAALEISRVLGHTGPIMAYQKYLGTEGRAAALRLDEVMRSIKQNHSK